MDSEYERQLEAEIDRELKALPSLTAPSTLSPGVLRVIAARTAPPRRRSSWSTWPIALRAASLAGLLALFAGLCFALSALPESGPVLAITEPCNDLLSGLGVLWRGLSCLPGLLAVGQQRVDMRLLLGVSAAVVLAFAAWVTLAAGSVRLVLARSRQPLL